MPLLECTTYLISMRKQVCMAHPSFPLLHFTLIPFSFFSFVLWYHITKSLCSRFLLYFKVCCLLPKSLPSSLLTMTSTVWLVALLMASCLCVHWYHLLRQSCVHLGGTKQQFWVGDGRQCDHYNKYNTPGPNRVLKCDIIILQVFHLNF